MAAHMLSGLGPVLSSNSSQSMQAPYKPTSTNPNPKASTSHLPSTMPVSATTDVKSLSANMQQQCAVGNTPSCAQPIFYPPCYVHPYPWVPAGGYPWAYYHQYAYQQYINYHKSFYQPQPSVKSEQAHDKGLLGAAFGDDQLEFVSVQQGDTQTRCEDKPICEQAQKDISDMNRATSVSPTNDSQADEYMNVKVPQSSSTAPSLLEEDPHAFALDEPFPTTSWPDPGLLPDDDDDILAGYEDPAGMDPFVDTDHSGFGADHPMGDPCAPATSQPPSMDIDIDPLYLIPNGSQPQGVGGQDSGLLLQSDRTEDPQRLAEGANAVHQGLLNSCIGQPVGDGMVPNLNPLMAQIAQNAQMSSVLALASSCRGNQPAHGGVGNQQQIALQQLQMQQMLLQYQNLVRSTFPQQRKEIVTTGLAALRSSTPCQPMSPIPTECAEPQPSHDNNNGQVPCSSNAFGMPPRQQITATPSQNLSGQTLSGEEDGATRSSRRPRPAKHMSVDYDYDPNALDGLGDLSMYPFPAQYTAKVKSKGAGAKSGANGSLKVTMPIAKKPKRPAQSQARYKSGGPCCNPGCQATTSPQWRRGPDYAPTLCNACGTRWARNGTFDLTSNGKVKRKPAGSGGSNGGSRWGQGFARQRASYRLIQWNTTPTQDVSQPPEAYATSEGAQNLALPPLPPTPPPPAQPSAQEQEAAPVQNVV